MWAHIIVLRLSVKLEVENWRLTHRALLHQYFPTLAARSLKLKTFSTTKHLSLFCLMCSCFLDAARTFLTHVETTVRHSDWLYKRFSHVKIKRIDFFK